MGRSSDVTQTDVEMQSQETKSISFENVPAPGRPISAREVSAGQDRGADTEDWYRDFYLQFDRAFTYVGPKLYKRTLDEDVEFFPYHMKLWTHQFQHPEMCRLPRLGKNEAGRQYHERVCVATVGTGKDSQMNIPTLFDLSEHAEYESFQTLLRDETDLGQIIVLPALTPLLVETLGSVLEVEPNVFLQHLHGGETYNSENDEPQAAVSPDILGTFAQMSTAHSIDFYSDVEDGKSGTSYTLSPLSQVCEWPTFASEYTARRSSFTWRSDPRRFYQHGRVTVHWLSSHSIAKKGFQCGDSPQVKDCKSNAEPTPFDAEMKSLVKFVSGAQATGSAVETAVLQWFASKLLSASTYQCWRDGQWLESFSRFGPVEFNPEKVNDSADVIADANWKFLTLLQRRQRDRIHALEDLHDRISYLEDPTSRARVDFTHIPGPFVRAAMRLQEKIDSERRFHETELQRNLTVLQISEIRLSIQQKSQPSQLTALAFVFVPMLTISSILGMNVSEFDTAPPSLATFGVIAGSVTAGVLLIASLSIIHAYLRGLPYKQNPRAGPAFSIRRYYKEKYNLLYPVLGVFERIYRTVARFCNWILFIHYRGRYRIEEERRFRRQEHFNKLWPWERSSMY